jgi:hypothetical protein
MADPGTTPPGGKKTFPLWLLALVILLVGYFIYRSFATRTPPPTEPPPTPVVVLETPTSPPVIPTAAPPTPTVTQVVEVPCQDWIVMVGPDPATLNHDPVCIGPSNHIVWTVASGGGSLKIFFPVSGYPKGLNPNIPPFAQMKRATAGGKDDWVFKYPGATSTQSGPPNTTLPGPPGTRWVFKYDQQIGDKRADGQMIIKK